MKAYWLIGLLLAYFAATAAAQSLPGSTYDVMPAESRLEVGVFRGGLLKIFGHDHRVAAQGMAGVVRFDPDHLEDSSLVLTIPAGSLTVLDTGESEQDRNEVQATMLSDKVLGVAAFPQIVFHSTGVGGTGLNDSVWQVRLAGKLRLHGVERTIEFPVRVRLDGTRLYGEGEVFLAQSDFGISPITAAGGLVRVKDRVRVSFRLVAEQTSPKGAGPVRDRRSGVLCGPTADQPHRATRTAPHTRVVAMMRPI